MLTAAIREHASTYILGHTDRKLQRLIDQPRFFGDLTAQVLHAAGIGLGMRVLDIGSGAGDVSFLATSMVGVQGSVIGVDKSPEAVILANEHATAAGLTSVRFECRDLEELVLDEPGMR